MSKLSYKKSLPKIIIPLVIAGISYLVLNDFEKDNYPDKWIKKYHNKVFSLEENRGNIVESLCLDNDGDGFEDGVWHAFDLNKQFWKKQKIEAIGYFRYHYGDVGPPQDNANLFYTIKGGNLEAISGGLRDNNPDKKLNKRLNSMEVEKLLEKYKKNAIKGRKIREKLEQKWEEYQKLLNPPKKT